MKRSKTVTVGELLDEFFQRPYVAAKVAEGRLRDTWREIVGPAADAETTELRLEITFCTSASARAFCATNFSTSAKPWAPKSTAARKSDWSMRSSSGEIHLFLRGGSTILGRYWHYSKKKCIFAR